MKIETSREARMCPRCAGKTMVYGGADQPDGGYLRRRKCLECGWKFTTVERLVEKI